MNDITEENELILSQTGTIEEDFSLVRKSAAGDETSFRLLVSRHKEKVRNLIFLTLNTAEPVDDIAQDVFITVFRNLNKFRYESQFTTWLYRITINKCKDHIRRQKIRSIFSPIKETDEEEISVNPFEDIDVSGIVQKAISKLPEKLRSPLILKEIEGLSYQEIAETLECEIGTVKSRIFRAREGLKKLLEPYQKELL
jgi:RNA polymerase sigma-70 factor (ECF subfamily)